MQSFRIVLAEDHTSLRQGIKELIQENAEFLIVAEAGDGSELSELLEKIPPRRGNRKPIFLILC